MYKTWARVWLVLVTWARVLVATWTRANVDKGLGGNGYKGYESRSNRNTISDIIVIIGPILPAYGTMYMFTCTRGSLHHTPH